MQTEITGYFLLTRGVIRMIKKKTKFTVLAFIFAVVSAGFYIGGICGVIYDEFYAYAWTSLIGLIPMIGTIILIPFINEIKNSRKIPIIISTLLLILGLTDCIAGQALCLPSAQDCFFYITFGTPVSAKHLTFVFTYFVFALSVFFIPLCKPIWAKAFCIAEIGLNSFYLIYIAVVDYLSLNHSDYLFSIAFIFFYLSFFFVACTMSKDCDEIFSVNKYNKLDYTNFFNRNANLEIACTNSRYNYKDYAIFYKHLRKNDYEYIKERGYGHDFIVQMIIDLKEILDASISDDSKLELILLKKKVDEVCSLHNNSIDLDYHYFIFLQFLTNATEQDIENELTVNINSKSEFPINILSNFSNNSFILDGVNIKCMESFLQSLKFKNIDKQKKICSLTAKEAEKAGKYHNLWKLSKMLYWNGKRINRYSKKYTELITRAYDAMAESNPEFVKILLSTEYKILADSELEDSKRKTLLTENEFTEEQLFRLRKKNKEKKSYE